MSGSVFEANGMTVVDGILRRHGLIAPDEVWVHGMWTPDKWWKCLTAKLTGKRLVRMTHGSLSPIYLRRQGKWKKRLVKPLEKLCFVLADRIVATGPWEVEWARAWGLKCSIDIIDLKRFYAIPPAEANPPSASLQRSDGASPLHGGPLRVLYLGRQHPLKGVRYLERAVQEINEESSVQSAERNGETGLSVQLRIVSDHFGDELEEDWKWADVLCLPTLSENFGLVVAEALERGKRVITTDGAPAWEGQIGVIYLKGYREGTDAERVRLLKDALEGLERVDG